MSNRVGPSTGLPTRTQQGDLNFALRSQPWRHSTYCIDSRELSMSALNLVDSFDVAEQFQTLGVFGFSDLDLGNEPMGYSRVRILRREIDRGKVIRTQEQLDAIENFGRYRDVDGDGIPYRTLPVVIIYRGETGHDEDGVYSKTLKYTLQLWLV